MNDSVDTCVKFVLAVLITTVLGILVNSIHTGSVCSDYCAHAGSDYTGHHTTSQGCLCEEDSE